MTQNYIGIKIVTAWPEEKNGQPGYAVKYSNGYTSWSPKDVFEASYFSMGEGNETKITETMVNDFMGQIEDSKISPKTTLVKVTPKTGFEQFEVSSCVDPANYDHKIGVEVATRKIRDRIWGHLGFVLQWARYGLKQ